MCVAEKRDGTFLLRQAVQCSLQVGKAYCSLFERLSSEEGLKTPYSSSVRWKFLDKCLVGP